jgi:hypothetical protein
MEGKKGPRLEKLRESKEIGNENTWKVAKSYFEISKFRI